MVLPGSCLVHTYQSGMIVHNVRGIQRFATIPRLLFRLSRHWHYVILFAARQLYFDAYFTIDRFSLVEYLRGNTNTHIQNERKRENSGA